MKLTTYHGCFETSTEINGEPIEQCSKEKLREAAILAVQKAKKEVLIELVNTYIEFAGRMTDTHHCDQCGDDNYEMEVEV